MTTYKARPPGVAAFSLHGNHDSAEPIAFIPSPERGRSKKELKSLRDRLSKTFNENLGLLLIGTSQFFVPCMNVSVQALSRLDPPIPPTEILVVRQTVTWVLTVFYMWYQGVSHPITGPPEVRFLLVIRGVCGFCGVFGVYYSLQYLSLSDATVLTFLSPFFTSLAGTFFLGEAFSRRNLIAGMCSLGGVVLIARPEAVFGPSLQTESESVKSAERGTPQQRLLAVAISMIGVFGASGAYTSLRAIGKRAHAMHSMTYFAFFSAIISIILMVAGRTKPVIPQEWKSAALLGPISVFGFLAQILLILGLQRETASRGSLAMYIQIVFASMLERMFFHVTPSMLSLSGTAIILTSAIYVVLNKTKEKQQSRPETEMHTIWEGDDISDRPGHISCTVEEEAALLEGLTHPEFVQED